ncbi:MAG: UbiA family prenyltransferase [Megasphaera sp.]|jgi:1,4-dihydroxy-2-naphthoate octaprenyltransferase|uniref:prenyltransferase n=1 Tax=Megasphaera sueciensis TaxID=349094 RepID=UPI003D08452F|nr:UbiA family prenyltransferase [Megasphaera sp.]MCI1824161.1 UbiA family prenyltransferase [Megasphaera sp.]
MERWNVLTPKLALRLAAPHTWPASICPALFGELYCVLAGYGLHFIVGTLLLCACILMQSSVNTFNDFFDYVKGVDSAADHVDADDAVLVYENLNPVHALWLAVIYLGAAVLVVMPVLLTAGIAPIVVGVAGGVAVVFYSGGPFPLSYLPVGEFVSGLVMGGLIPLGILAAITGDFHWIVLLAALPFVLGIGLIMMTNNICDIVKDREAKRKTLPVLLGYEHAVRLYRIVTVLWILFLCILPVWLLGFWGIICPMLMVVSAHKLFRFLLTSSLTPGQRIVQMKGILRANIFGNGAYIVTLAFCVLMGASIYG